MGLCIYCGQPAGFLRRKHKECNKQHQLGKSHIISLVRDTGAMGGELQQLEAKINQIAEKSFIGKNDLKSLVVNGWEQAVEAAFNDGILTKEEEDVLGELQKHFSLSQGLLDRSGAFTRIVKGAILRDLLEGIIPERVQIDGNLPFNFQKSERIVWVFQDVRYYEEKTRTQYVGGTQGVSLRIAKGVYYRTGGFKGERMQTAETVHVDSGLLGVTNKHIYFAGANKSFRIAYNKIVTFSPYSDGIGVQRDAASAKPQTFATGDGWFTYNLIANCARM